jgi:cardiolipin synthase
MLTLLRDGREAFPAMLDAIARAEREVLLEMYWFDASDIGVRFVKALAERARAGVPVRVLYDAIGSLGVEPETFDPITKAGGHVIEFNPIAPWRRRFRVTQVSRRDHRKILVVDDVVGFVGGLNIGQPWMPVEEGGEAWRDDIARVEGPAVNALRDLFYDTWCQLGGDRPVEVARRSRDEIVRAARREVGLLSPETRGGPIVSVLGHDAWSARRIIRTVYLSRIRQARSRIFIANSYFAPDWTVRRALEKAARRGVEVRVIVPRMSDVPAVTWAGRHLYTGMMKAGIHVHEWVRGILHAKTGLIDEWATTGSYNLDFMSFRNNLEVNVATSEPDFVAAVERSFARDLKDGCEEVDPVKWRFRPWGEKLRDWVFYLFRKFL